jgi:hypothetical protein
VAALGGCVVAFLVASCHTYNHPGAVPALPAGGPAGDLVEEGELSVLDGATLTVNYKTPFQSPPRLTVSEIRESRFRDRPYSKLSFSFPVVTATYFTLQNNHSEPDVGGWAIIRWRAQGFCAPAAPAQSVGRALPLTPQQRQQQFFALVGKARGSVQVDPTVAGSPVIAIDLHDVHVGDADLEPLADFTFLRRLNLYNTRITDTTLAYLHGHTRLETLYLNNTAVTDAGLQHLQALTGLRELGLFNTRVTDAGLVNLPKLTNLQRLSLSGRGVTDAGLANLRELKNLHELDLIGTQVTAAGAQQLQQALPRLHIVY